MVAVEHSDDISREKEVKRKEQRERRIKRQPVVLAIFIILICAWAFRYQVISLPGPAFFRMNRWTGKVEWCKKGDGCSGIGLKKKSTGVIRID